MAAAPVRTRRRAAGAQACGRRSAVLPINFPAKPPAVVLQGYGVIFYGDSLMETWRGTDHCGSCDAIKGRATCRGASAVFERYFKRHRPAVMGIGGDQVANLIWRLQHGQMPQQNKVGGVRG